MLRMDADIRGIMKQASLTHLRRNLSDMLNAVNADHEPLVVTRRRGKPVVLMSLEDYQAMERTQRAEATSNSALGLWKALSEVDEMAFVPRADDAVKSDVAIKAVVPAKQVDTAPAFKRHPSR